MKLVIFLWGLALPLLAQAGIDDLIPDVGVLGSQNVYPEGVPNRIRRCPKEDNSLWLDTLTNGDDNGWNLLQTEVIGVICVESNGESPSHDKSNDPAWYLIGTDTGVPTALGYVHAKSVRMDDSNKKVPECEAVALPQPPDRWCMCVVTKDAFKPEEITCYDTGRIEPVKWPNYKINRFKPNSN